MTDTTRKEENCACEIDRSHSSRVRWFFREGWVDRVLFNWLSVQWGGSNDLPLGHDSVTIRGQHGQEHVFGFINDAFEVGVGNPDKWHVFLRREDFHKIVRWYVAKWIFVEWFGLRRWAWYKVLSRRVSRNKDITKLS